MSVHAVQTCKWAIPTMFLPWPLWYDASEQDWSCTLGPAPRGVPDPTCCAACRNWTGKDVCQASTHEAHLGSVRD
jgi:hypothetical protein